jgi:hypothetical protein
VSEKFKLIFAGRPSLFEGKTVPPVGFDEVKLQILAADEAGNFGEHTLPFRVSQ